MFNGTWSFKMKTLLAAALLVLPVAAVSMPVSAQEARDTCAIYASADCTPSSLVNSNNSLGDRNDRD
jgi:hypothetical protein